MRTTAGTGVHEHARTFPRHLRVAPAARQFVRQAVAGHPAAEDAALLAAELIANSLAHACDATTVTVTVAVSEALIRVDVRDDGHPRHPAHAPGQPGRRGRPRVPAHQPDRTAVGLHPRTGRLMLLGRDHQPSHLIKVPGRPKREISVIEAPSARRLLIGAALRRYRENLGFILDDAARVLECDRSKISRIETGQRGIRPKELRELLTEYGVGEQEQHTLTAIAQSRNGSNWQRHGNALPGPYHEYLALEQAASDIFIYDPQHIPDLLQTPKYTQASATGSPSIRDDAGLTLFRQHFVRERRIRLTALIGEAALRQAHDDPGVVRDQLRVLADVGGRTAVYVLPSHCVPSSSGPATILRFAAVPGLGAVYLPGLSGGACLTGQQDIANHTKAFEQLRTSALPPAASARLIREIAAA
jgi:transcriptional regulator with XRE-family HTH domain/anti-sigma regulatory factor (Ser/Thr protein kinase)